MAQMNAVIGPNWFTVIFRVVFIGLGAGMVGLLVFAALNATPTSTQLLFALLALLPLCFVLLPALRGLLTWPINVRIDTTNGILFVRSLLRGKESYRVDQISEVRNTKFWHGGRRYCDGVILLLADGKRLIFSAGNLRSVRDIQGAFKQAGIPSVKSVDAFP